MKTIELSERKAHELYKTASGEFKVLLEENFDKKVLIGNILERITTWQDVCKEAVINFANVCPWTYANTKEKRAQNAYAKLQLISKVLNEGWEPDFTDTNQYKWYNWFQKDAHGRGWRPHDYGSYCFSDVYSGAGLYFKDKKTAEHAAKNFLDIYIEYLPE